MPYYIFKVRRFIAALILLTACAAADEKQNVLSEPEQVMSENVSAAKISMTSSAKVEEGKLIISYTIQSNWSSSLYIFDEMIKYDGEGKPSIDRDTAYCFFEEPNTLRLVRAILNIPKEKDIYSLEIPYARELKPRQALEGKMVLDLPVKEKSPFYPLPKEEDAREVDCEYIRLLVGWTEFREGTKITEADIGGQKVLRIRGSWQPFLLENKVAQKTKVIAHTTVFDRQLPQKAQ